MSARDVDWRDVQIARIRALQSIHATAHAALLNWGAWSRDKRGIFPTVAPPGVWDQFAPNPADIEGWASSDAPPAEPPTDAPAKREAPERPPYQERPAIVLDERLHHPGGLCVETRHVLRAAYVSEEIPEDQFHTMCGCSTDAFCERLESALLFVARFTP